MTDASPTVQPCTVRLLLRARHALTLAIDLTLVRLQTASDPVHQLKGVLTELRIHVARLEEENQYLRDRLARIAPRHRSHYSPVERFRILVFMQTYGLSWADTADRFLVSVNTIARWMREATTAPTRRSVGVLLKATPPLRRYSDVVRDLVSQMDAWGFGGNRRIAQTLARAGVRIGRETIRRWRRAPRLPPPKTARRGFVAPVRARRPNDVWLIDLTTIRSLFGLHAFHVSVVLDAYARLPLSAGVFVREPTARQVARLVSRAARRVGAPRYLVSDRGSQFTARLFAQTLGRLGIRHRFGAVGSPGATARIERFWRTLKMLVAVRCRPPLTRTDLATRLEAALTYYAMFKPHAGLSGATPLEIYLGLTPVHTRARAPTPLADMPHLDLSYLDRDRRLPIVLARAA